MQQFFYVQFEVDPKGSLARPSKNQKVVIEVPARHVADWRIERPHLSLTDEQIVIEIAQPVAIATAAKSAPLTHSPLKQREICCPIFVAQRLPVMNERSCDYEDNGIRSWIIT
ncbi:MAG: hypothetical protein JO308_02525 [Verrucomicrobia bacterium]|nr:hypothetical protein [Verrucomicrobiota bacterium]